MPLADHPDGIVDHGQGLQAQHVDLEHPDLLEAHHVVLRDDRVGFLRGEAHRDVVGERPRSDHHACGVHRGVAGQALDPGAEVEDLADALVLAGEGSELRRALRRLRERHVHALPPRRDQLAETVHFPRLHPQRPRHIAERGPGFQRAEGDDLADRVPPVALADVLDHLAPPLEAEVEVDVRHRDALRVEEPLEQQVERERVDVGDAERMGHERSGRRAAPRPHGNPPVLRRLDDVVHDQEVAGVPRARDHPQLVVEPFLHRLRQGIAVASLGSGLGQVDEEVVVRRELRGPGELRQEVALLEVELAQLGDAGALGQDLGMVREQRPHLRFRLDVALPPQEAESVRIVQVLPGADGQQNVVRLGVLFP